MQAQFRSLLSRYRNRLVSIDLQAEWSFAHGAVRSVAENNLSWLVQTVELLHYGYFTRMACTCCVTNVFHSPVP